MVPTAEAHFISSQKEDPIIHGIDFTCTYVSDGILILQSIYNQSSLIPCGMCLPLVPGLLFRCILNLLGLKQLSSLK